MNENNNVRGRGGESEGSKGFFFEKKNQKTFVIWAAGVFNGTAQSPKVFGAPFFKKALLSLSS